MKMDYKLIGVIFSDVPTGTKNQLWAATAPKEEVRKSYFLNPVAKKSGGSFWMAQNSENAVDLWDWSEKELERHGY